jgi:hypothetical protein
MTLTTALVLAQGAAALVGVTVSVMLQWLASRRHRRRSSRGDY